MVDAFLDEHGPTYLAAILQAIDHGVIAMDERCICTFVNAAGAAILWYSPDDLVGKDLHATIHAVVVTSLVGGADAGVVITIAVGDGRAKSATLRHGTGAGRTGGCADPPGTG